MCSLIRLQIVEALHGVSMLCCTAHLHAAPPAVLRADLRVADEEGSSVSGPVYQQPGSVKQFQRAGSAGQSSEGRESGFQSSGSLASLPGPAWPPPAPPLVTSK